MVGTLFEWKNLRDHNDKPQVALRTFFQIEEEHIKHGFFRDGVVQAFSDSLEDFAKENGYGREETRGSDT